MKLPWGGENGRRKMISNLRNVYIRPQRLGGHKIKRDSILKIGMKFSRKKKNGKRQRILQMVFRSGDLEINPVGYRFILSSVLNTKGRGRM